MQVRLASEEELELCHAIRREVFILGQGVTEEEEMDGLDGECLHVLALEGSRGLGTARLRDYGSGVAKIERVAVRPEAQGQGIGRLLMEELEQQANRRGFQEALLAAQVAVLPFYQKLGYQVEGELFLDARIEHRWMRKRLTP